jgi:uncharacterized protein
VDRVYLRFYGDLGELTDVADRGGVADVPLGDPRSVKDLIESLGVPHTEVGLLLVDGEPAGFDRLIKGCERVAVFPPFRTIDVGGANRVEPPDPHPHRFLLDVHLGRLAGLLRLLGLDSRYDNDADDATLASVSVSEGRTLLTRDRRLLMRKEVVHGYLVRNTDPERQALEVVARFGLGAEVDPFRRCMACNGQLEHADKEAVLDQLPPRTRRDHDRFVRCPDCDRVYWAGSHYDRLVRLVERLTTEA